MKADPSVQLKLLDVADLDRRIAQLRHQLSAMPELVEIKNVTAARGDLDDQARDAQILVDDLTAEQAKADADVEQVKARRTRDQARMDAGQITNPKDLERMQHELVSLERRISTLEDAEIEVMERLEEAQNTLTSTIEKRDQADTKLAELEDARGQKAGELETDLAKLSLERTSGAGALPTDLMALYDRIREQKGVGAAALRARQCGGCQLTLNAADLGKIKAAPADEVVRCEECSRILVRTPESGL